MRIPKTEEELAIFLEGAEEAFEKDRAIDGIVIPQKPEDKFHLYLITRLYEIDYPLRMMLQAIMMGRLHLKLRSGGDKATEFALSIVRALPEIVDRIEKGNLVNLKEGPDLVARFMHEHSDMECKDCPLYEHELCPGKDEEENDILT